MDRMLELSFLRTRQYQCYLIPQNGPGLPVSHERDAGPRISSRVVRFLRLLEIYQAAHDTEKQRARARTNITASQKRARYRKLTSHPMKTDINKNDSSDRWSLRRGRRNSGFTQPKMVAVTANGRRRAVSCGRVAYLPDRHQY